MRIAQRFNAGLGQPMEQAPNPRLRNSSRSAVPSALRKFFLRFRSLKAPAASQSSVRRKGPKLLALLSPVFAFPCLAAFGQFSASLDRDTVILGETVTLSLKFENVQPRALPNIPTIPGLPVAGGAGSSSQTKIENGATTSIVTYTVPLAPQKAGEYEIPAMTAEIEGKRVQSQPLKLKVLQSDPSAPPAEYANKLAFLWPVLPKKELYVGEIMVTELRLYLRSETRRLSALQVPPLRGDGFTIGNQVNGQRFQRRVGTATFTIIPILQTITPIKTGDLEVSAINGSVVLHVVTGGQRSLLDFDAEDPFGPATRAQQVPLTVEQRTLHVLPLPEQNVPPGFSGAIGSYNMNCTAGPTNVTAGDPITVRIQISGRGYLQGISMPELNWNDFKTYPPTSRTETTDPLGTQGTKYFEQLVTPQSPDIKELPAILFSYFDPDAKSYRTLSQAPIKLTVRPGGTTIAPTIAASRDTNEKPATTQDIVPIKQRFGKMTANAQPILTRPWFLALQAVPALAFFGALTWRKRGESLANNPRLRRKRLVEQIMRNGSQQMKRLADENKSDEFFGAMFRLLQEQIGERLDLPASAITEAVVEENLRPRDVSRPTLHMVQELFQTCNLARYAPLKSSEELHGVLQRFEAAVAALKAELK
jgi:hypothetical protein